MPVLSALQGDNLGTRADVIDIAVRFEQTGKVLSRVMFGLYR
jgi:hypothetical protein